MTFTQSLKRTAPAINLAETLSPPRAGFFVGERLDLPQINPNQTERTNMAATKKTDAKKKPATKKAGFVPKVKSTKKNGMGTY